MHTKDGPVRMTRPVDARPSANADARRELTEARRRHAEELRKNNDVLEGAIAAAHYWKDRALGFEYVLARRNGDEDADDLREKLREHRNVRADFLLRIAGDFDEGLASILDEEAS